MAVNPVGCIVTMFVLSGYSAQKVIADGVPINSVPAVPRIGLFWKYTVFHDGGTESCTPYADSAIQPVGVGPAEAVAVVASAIVVEVTAETETSWGGNGHHDGAAAPVMRRNPGANTAIQPFGITLWCFHGLLRSSAALLCCAPLLRSSAALACCETIEVTYIDAAEGRKVRRSPMPVSLSPPLPLSPPVLNCMLSETGMPIGTS
jgi:hypothetical protein